MSPAADTGGLLLRANLLRLAIGSWQAHLLFTANRIGVFDVLAEEEGASAAALAVRLGTHTFPTELTLNACVALGLLVREGDGYRNGEMARRHLVRGGDEYLGDWIRLMGDHWGAVWARLEHTLREGEPVEDPAEHLGRDQAYTRRFILAMHQYALVFGRSFADGLDLGEARHVLDVGGGAGTYSILLARTRPALRATVFDVGPVAAIARETIARHGLVDRIDVVEGDYHADRLPEGADVVLLSNVVQQEPPAACRRLLGAARTALGTGGTIVVQGMFLEETRTEPLWVALHSLTMLMVAGGRAYTFGEMEAMLRDVGCTRVELVRPRLLNAEAFFVARV